jgi:hypothetical protein
MYIDVATSFGGKFDAEMGLYAAETSLALKCLIETLALSKQPHDFA